jgi:hypothetical protein
MPPTPGWVKGPFPLEADTTPADQVGRGVAQGGERGQEHGVLEPVVAVAAAGLAG